MAVALLCGLRDSARKIRLLHVRDVPAQMVDAAGQRFGLERMKDGITRIANGLIPAFYCENAGRIDDRHARAMRSPRPVRAPGLQDAWSCLQAGSPDPAPVGGCRRTFSSTVANASSWGLSQEKENCRQTHHETNGAVAVHGQGNRRLADPHISRVQQLTRTQFTKSSQQPAGAPGSINLKTGIAPGHEMLHNLPPILYEPENDHES